MMRSCLICGADISGMHGNRATCSDVCSKSLKRRREREGELRWRARYPEKYREKEERRRTRLRERRLLESSEPKLCLHCRAPVVGRAPQAKFCSQECLRAATSQRERRHRRDSAKPLTYTCEQCSTSFASTRRAKYCCDLCKKRAEKRRWREKIAMYRAAYPARYREHRDLENQRRSNAYAALKLIREIETKGLEALL